MSLTAALLFGQKPTIRGTSTMYLVSDYRDGQKPKNPDHDLESSLNPKSTQNPSAYQHMVEQKMANIAIIKASLRAGMRTQKEINLRTRIPKGTLCTRMAGLVKTGEVVVSKDVWPWQYFLTVVKK